MSSRSMYVNGSAARRLHAPKENKNIRRVPARVDGKTVQRSTGYVMMIVRAVIIMAVVAMLYVTEQADVTNLRNKKGQLQSQYEDLRVSNDLYYEDIVSNVNIKEIERIAVEELGMKMAGSGQILTYANDVDDYVKQYVDMPN